MNRFITLIFAAFTLLGCQDSNIDSEEPQHFNTAVDFAKTRINEAAKGKSINPEVKFIMDIDSYDSEEFEIKQAEGYYSVLAGDSTGLMYGGLEIAEQIELNERLNPTRSTPYLKRRGIKFNIPLDARTPSYDDSGDAAQKNIAEMWNWQFWQEFLDKMALYRYNTLTLWNPHPFPSMIKLEDYPKVALNDVCVTTLKPVGMENEWGEPGLVSANVMENLRVVKKISIEEKIIFWKKVMRYARHRGIDVYFINWNLCPNSVANPVPAFYKTYGINLQDKQQPGKHGVTYELDNPTTIDYYRKATKTFLLTYSDLKGIGVTAGEHMPKTWDTNNREEWLWKTYGLGILDAKKVQPNRQVDFIHRVWDSDMDQIMKFWGNYPDRFEVSFKYAKARLYSSPNIPFAQQHIESMEQYGLKSWWNLRNDDIFVYRWGDPDYVREFINYLPDEQHTAGFHMGSDGYVWGREFISRNDDLKGEIEIDKHWFNFMLWGRLGYDNELDEAFFVKKIHQHFPNTDAQTLYSTWQIASKIIPLVNTFHWRDWDHHWSVESCFARPVLGGYRDVLDFIDNPTMQGSNMLNPAQYARSLSRGENATQTTPIHIIESLNVLADKALVEAEGLRKPGNSPELQTLLDDITAMAYLGQYYACKISAATNLASYALSENANDKQNAIDNLELAVVKWQQYKNISEQNYHAQMLARVHWLDWTMVMKYVIEDISIARGFRVETP